MNRDVIDALHAEYDVDHGFVGQLRLGTFDELALARILALLRSIHIPDSVAIDRELVRLLWLLPEIVDASADAVGTRLPNAQVLIHGQGEIRKLVESLLGTP